MKTIQRAANIAAAGAALVAVASAAAAQEDSSRVVAITGVDVIDAGAGQALADRTVVIENGRIRSVEAGGSAPAGAMVIDGSGKYLMPGLWDMHAHLRHEAAPALLMPQFIAYGVTGVRDMGSDCDGPPEGKVCLQRMREWQASIESDQLLGPRLLALSTWAVNPPWDYQVTREQVSEVVGRFAEQRVDLIKLYYRVSAQAFAWLMEDANRAGLPVGGHIPLRVTATEASDAGLRSLEHARDFLFDCFPGSAEFRRTAMSQNPPMDVMKSMVDDHDAAQCDDVFRTFIRNDTWYVPTHVTRRMDAYADDPEFRADPRAKYIPADLWKGWQEDADRMVALDPSPEGRRIMRGFYEKGLEITGRAHRAGVKIVLGTDAGDTYVFPGSGVHDELGELVKAGLSPAEALAAATSRSAEFLGLEAEYGSVEPGKRSDLVLLNANPLEDISNTRMIETVFFNRRVLTRADLDELLREVERLVAQQQ